MVAAVRHKAPMREVARRFRVALSTVQLWVARAGNRRPDRVDWTDRPDGPQRPVNRSTAEMEDLVLATRRELKDTSDLGVRRPAPPPGWYLPDVAERRTELDSFDIVEGLVIKGGTPVEVLNGIALHGGLTASWPMGVVTAKAAVEAILGMSCWPTSCPPGRSPTTPTARS
jgi:hypothetical protein